MTMNIHALSGTPVMAVQENMIVQNGHQVDKDLVLTHIELDKVYHVNYTVVGDWTTKVYLMEVPGIAFNSVNFKEV